MTGHEDGGGEMISDSGRYSDKSVGLCQVEERTRLGRSASYRARLLCLVASRDRWNRSNPFTNFATVERGVVDSRRGPRRAIETINDIDKRSCSSRCGIRDGGRPPISIHSSSSSSFLSYPDVPNFPPIHNDKADIYHIGSGFRNFSTTSRTWLILRNFS